MKLRLAFPCALALAALVSTASPAPADERAWGPLHVKLLLTVLAYDRQLEQAPGHVFSLGVLYRPEQSASIAARDEILAELLQLASTMQFHGRTIAARPVAWSGAAELDRFLAATGVRALYLGTGLTGPDVEAIVEVTRRRDVRTLTAQRAFVERGAAIGVEIDRLTDRPRLVINLAAARAEGAELPARVLRLADVVAAPGAGGGALP